MHTSKTHNIQETTISCAMRPMLEFTKKCALGEQLFKLNVDYKPTTALVLLFKLNCGRVNYTRSCTTFKSPLFLLNGSCVNSNQYSLL